MRDCADADIRDLLPDLLHERLAAPERERVLAHVHACPDCAAELALLRTAARAVKAATTHVDGAAIARAVKAAMRARGDASAPRLTLVAPARPVRRWSSTPLRAAAAIVVMALGATGVLVARRGTFERTSVPVIDTSSRAVAITPTPDTQLAVMTPSSPTIAVPNAGRRVAQPAPAALGASFADLSDAELAAVIAAVDGSADVGPSAEPTPTPTIVTSGTIR
jgi:hypothetical protein